MIVCLVWEVGTDVPDGAASGVGDHLPSDNCAIGYGTPRDHSRLAFVGAGIRPRRVESGESIALAFGKPFDFGKHPEIRQIVVTTVIAHENPDSRSGHDRIAMPQALVVHKVDRGVRAHEMVCIIGKDHLPNAPGCFTRKDHLPGLKFSHGTGGVN
jgi:hypothetical protein